MRIIVSAHGSLRIAGIIVWGLGGTRAWDLTFGDWLCDGIGVQAELRVLSLK